MIYFPPFPILYFRLWISYWATVAPSVDRQSAVVLGKIQTHDMATIQANSFMARMGTLIPTYPGQGPPTGMFHLGGPLFYKYAPKIISTDANGKVIVTSPATRLEEAQVRRKTVCCGSHAFVVSFFLITIPFILL